MRPTPDLLRRQFREPALHEVQPRAIGGCEVHVKPGTLGEPRPDERCFVRSVIVHDEVDVPIGWYAGVDAVQELAELDRPMAAIDRKSTRLNSSHRCISYAVFC